MASSAAVDCADIPDMWKMDNPRAVTYAGQSPRDLQSARVGHQRSLVVRQHARKGVQSVKGALLGVILGAAAVFVFCVLDKQAFFWQTAAWEAGLCGLAGVTLGRISGGPIAGGALFGAAYTAALFLRQSQYNSIKVIEPFLPLREVNVHQDFAMLASLAVCGAFLGYLNSLK